MGFKPDLQGQAAPSEASEQEGLEFLKTQRDDKTYAGDPAKAEKQTDEARRKTLRALNALRIVGPLLAAVMEKPGAGASDEESAKAFKALVASTSALSEKVSRKLGADPEDPSNFWIRNMLERAFAEALKDQWAKNQSADLSALEGPIDALIAMDAPWADAGREFESLSIESTVRSSLIRAATPVLMKAQLGFDFFRNMDNEIEPIMRHLMGAASKAALSMADPNASEKDRAGLFSILISEAGNLYATSWWVAGKQAVKDVSKLSDSELQAMLKDHPDGLPLDSVNTLFEKNFNRLVSVANRLVPPKAGKIDARIKPEAAGKAPK